MKNKLWKPPPEYKTTHKTLLEILVNDAGMEIVYHERIASIKDIIYPEWDMEAICNEFNQLPENCKLDAYYYEERVMRKVQQED
jgi:hypothetical protein